MKKIKWGEKRYYTSLTADEFMHSKKLKEKKIKNNHRYLQYGIITRTFWWLFYYLIAFPLCWIIAKAKCGVRVKGKKNVRKVRGGAVVIGNHVHPLDCVIASVFVSYPNRNYFITKKVAVEVPFARFFTKPLGALPLPDETKGLPNLANTVDKLLRHGNFVTIYPEASLWPYCTFLRPFKPASFHYAVKANVPIIPFAITFRYAKFRKDKRPPKINLTILEPIYPVGETDAEKRKYLCEKTTEAIRNVVESKDNVAFYEYLPIEEKVEN